MVTGTLQSSSGSNQITDHRKQTSNQKYLFGFNACIDIFYTLSSCPVTVAIKKGFAKAKLDLVIANSGVSTMSENIANTYAVVDKSKKTNKNKNETSSHVLEPAVNVYAVVDKRKNAKPVDDQNTYDAVTSDKLYYNTVDNTTTEDAIVYDSASGPTYSQLDSNQVPKSSSVASYDVASMGRKALKDDSRREGFCSNKMCLLAWLIILIIVVVAAVVALIVAFVLIINLHSDIKVIMTKSGNSQRLNNSEFTSPNISSISPFGMNFTELESMFKIFSNEIEQRLDSLRSNLNTETSQLEDQANNLTYIQGRLFVMKPEVLKTISELEDGLKDSFNEASSNVSSKLENTRQQISTEIFNTINATQGSMDNLATSVANSIQAKYEFESCININTFSLPFRTGEYLIRTSDNNVTRMNCTLYTCDGVSGGWKRVAYLDVNDSSASACPNGLQQIDSPLSCRRTATGGGCSAVTYAINDNYKCIFGRINALQVGTPDGFQRHTLSRPATPTINDNYVDGVSLTHGSSPRTHIWTYIATAPSCTSCSTRFPAFLDSSQYTCDANSGCMANQVCSNLLWNGNECVGTTTFYRQLPQPTSDDIDMRVCRDEGRLNEDFLLTFIEIYVV